MKTFKGMITDTPSPAVPEEFNHPSYLSEGSSYPILKKIGAWPMMDHIDDLGECQAESRFILGVAGQLGLPGNVELVYVWTTQDSLDIPVVAVGRFSDGKKKLVIEGKRDLWKEVDENGNTVRELALLERDHATRKHEGSRYTGTVNYFEACIRVTYGTEPDENGHSVPKVRYYAPGAGVYKNEMQVMTIYSLCEIKYENGQVIIEKVLKEYTDNWWKQPKKK